MNLEQIVDGMNEPQKSVQDKKEAREITNEVRRNREEALFKGILEDITTACKDGKDSIVGYPPKDGFTTVVRQKLIKLGFVVVDLHYPDGTVHEIKW